MAYFLGHPVDIEASVLGASSQGRPWQLVSSKHYRLQIREASGDLIGVRGKRVMYRQQERDKTGMTAVIANIMDVYIARAELFMGWFSSIRLTNPTNPQHWIMKWSCVSEPSRPRTKKLASRKTYPIRGMIVKSFCLHIGKRRHVGCMLHAEAVKHRKRTYDCEPSCLRLHTSWNARSCNNNFQNSEF